MTSFPEPFNPDTAYNDTSLFIPGARRAHLLLETPGGDLDPPYYDARAVRTDWAKGDYQQMSPAFQASAITCGWQVWCDPAVPQPELDSTLRILEGPDEGDYLIAGIARERYGARWLFACIVGQG